MKRSSRVVMLPFILMLLAYAGPVLAEPPVAQKPAAKKPGKFLRIQRDDKHEPIALETAIVRYVPAKGEGKLTVDLIGAVHIGDRSYYEQLNKQFEQYDVLLYELVAAPGTRIPKGGKRDKSNPIAMIQQISKFVLDLESQTEQVDYTKKNFVHADLSPEQMAEAVRQRGDDGVTLFLSITADLLRQQNLQQQKKQEQAGKEEKEIDWSEMLLDPEGPSKLKRLMARHFEDLDGLGGLGHTLNTILISDRNQAALKVFQKELAQGKKKIGIFYGAAHMPDFEKRLRDDFGLQRHSASWLTAWDLRPRQRNLLDLLKLLDEVLNK